MMPLDLSYWAAAWPGTTPSSKLPNANRFKPSPRHRERQPRLKAWYSTNYDLSFESLPEPLHHFQSGLFDIDISSSSTNGTVSRCNLPDSDGVVRRCTRSQPISRAMAPPARGGGERQKGVRFPARALVGLGVDANYTFSPSNTGTDRRRQSDSFPRQLSPSSQLILWYEKYGLQARVARTTVRPRPCSRIMAASKGSRSTRRRPPSSMLLELRLWKDAHGLFRGLQPDGESQHFYLVWPDSASTSNSRRNILGFRLKYSAPQRCARRADLDSCILARRGADSWTIDHRLAKSSAPPPRASEARHRQRNLEAAVVRHPRSRS